MFFFLLFRVEKPRLQNPINLNSRTQTLNIKTKTPITITTTNLHIGEMIMGYLLSITNTICLEKHQMKPNQTTQNTQNHGNERIMTISCDHL